MPRLVDESELQAHRQMVEDNMLFRADFEESTMVSDGTGTGGKVQSWSVVAGLSNIPVSCVAMSGDETTAAQQIAPNSNAFVYAPWRLGALIKAKYRVVVRGDIDGVPFVETYGILYVAVPKTYSVRTTMYCRSGAATAGEPRLSAQNPGNRAPNEAPDAPKAVVGAQGLGNVGTVIRGTGTIAVGSPLGPLRVAANGTSDFPGPR